MQVGVVCSYSFTIDSAYSPDPLPMTITLGICCITGQSTPWLVVSFISSSTSILQILLSPDNIMCLGMAGRTTTVKYCEEASIVKYLLIVVKIISPSKVSSNRYHVLLYLITSPPSASTHRSSLSIPVFPFLAYREFQAHIPQWMLLARTLEKAGLIVSGDCAQTQSPLNDKSVSRYSQQHWLWDLPSLVSWLRAFIVASHWRSAKQWMEWYTKG